jgi:hypothetical protein
MRENLNGAFTVDFISAFLCFCMYVRLYRKADNARRYPRTSIARGEAELVSAPTAVILACVNDNGTSNDAVRADEVNDLVLERDGALPILGHNDIAQGPHLALLV